MPVSAAVYIMANWNDRVVYIGVTGDLLRRVAEHKLELADGFTRKYHCHKLVYYETGSDIHGAIAREKQLKAWRRDWKNQLIEQANPTWRDLAPDIGLTDEVLASYERLRRQAP